jgi:tRNA G18 (ribose-2'-O)-methylase SpoU
MSKLKVRTRPDLSLNSAKHQEACVNDKDFTAWQYNVADRFKSKTTEEIRQELRTTAHPFAVAMENWRGNFNFSTLVRNANAFNAREVFYLGDKKWDRRGAVGVHNYTDVVFVPTIDEFLKLKQQYVFVGIDNIAGKSVSVSSYQFVPNTLFVFGEEEAGLTPEMQSFCKDIVEIPMYGSVRSLNCGTASGIIMHEFVSKYINSVGHL